jgi:hypothetical protein
LLVELAPGFDQSESKRLEAMLNFFFILKIFAEKIGVFWLKLQQNFAKMSS